MFSMPLLRILTDVRSYIEINAAPVGEATPDTFLPYAALNSGTFYICAYPLEAGHSPRLPTAVKLCVENSRPVAPLPERAKVCVWPNGTIDVSLRLNALKCACASRPRELAIAEDSPLGKRLTLFDDHGLKLLCEGGDGSTMYALGAGIGGSISTLDVGDKLLAVVHAQLHEGERLLIMDADETALLDLEGDAVGVEDGRPFALTRLQTSRQHERRVVYDYINGVFCKVSDERGFFSHSAAPLNSRANIAIALCEAAREGLYVEALSLLTPDMRSDETVDAIRELCGGFEYAALPIGVEDSTTLGLCLPEGDGLYRAKLLRFEFAESLVSDIEEV
ncbi:MAG: hypothetical protein Q4B99_00755 [Clostridia bacterium]|nr:hypothetical protein [Clostridia bacterium]